MARMILAVAIGFALAHAQMFPGARMSWPLRAGEPIPDSIEIVSQGDGSRYFLTRLYDTFPPSAEIQSQDFIEVPYLIPRNTPIGLYRILDPRSEAPRFASVDNVPLDLMYVEVRRSFWAARTGLAYAHQRTGDGSIRRNMLFDPARAGDQMILWGTGVRLAEVTVDGVAAPATIEHQTNGVDRIEFTIPEAVRSDCYVPVVLNGGTTVSVSIGESGDAGRPCRHRMGFSAQEMLRLDRGDQLPVAGVQFRNSFTDIDYADYASSEVAELVGVLQEKAPAYGCSGRRTFIPSRSMSSAGSPGGNYGLAAELTGPDGAKTSSWSLGHWSFPAAWTGGTWSFSILGEAGEQLHGWTTLARRAPEWIHPPDWSQFSRSRDFLVAWRPEAFRDGEYVSFQFSAPGEDLSTYVVKCAVPASSGSLTVPAALMRDIPVPVAFPITLSASIVFHLQPDVVVGAGDRRGITHYQFGSAPAIGQPLRD